MADDGIGVPLSRRVPGETRPGPGQAVRPVLPESVLNRMQAAIDAEHAQAEARQPGEPNTEPLPRVTASAPPTRRGAKRPPSPSGIGPDVEALPDQAAKPEGVAKPPRAAKSPPAEEPLRVAKALRAAAELRAAEELRAAAELRAAEAARVRATEPEQPRAAEPEPPQAEQTPPPPVPDYPAQPPRTTTPPRATRPSVTAAFDSGPTPGSISWLWPEEPATRGGGGPRWQPPSRWRYRTATLVALAAVVLAGAGLMIGLSLHSSGGRPAASGTSGPQATTPPGTGASAPAGTSGPPVGPPADPYAVRAAVAWVRQQVAPSTAVACDAQTCAVMTAIGFPAQQVQLGLHSQSLSKASIVIVTPALRTLFSKANPSLGNHVAPQVLARFGPVTIQAVDPKGAAAYQAALSQDVQSRIRLGEQLLNSGNVSVLPVARRELAAGDVDARVELALQALARQEPIQVLRFAYAGPGASPGIPLRAVDLARMDPAAGIAPGAYLQTMVQLIRAHASFPAWLRGGPVTLGTGQVVVQIVYAAPSPLGLLSH
jgi:hypothetical protein